MQNIFVNSHFLRQDFSHEEPESQIEWINLNNRSNSPLVMVFVYLKGQGKGSACNAVLLLCFFPLIWGTKSRDTVPLRAVPHPCFLSGHVSSLVAAPITAGLLFETAR